MSVYYNEIEPYCVEWLKNLMAAGEIPDGVIDNRPIQEVKPEDLVGFTHCHFFAGIGGWAYATRIAGWPEDRELWTGSCPCQPFSGTGKRLGFKDERHLWPAWFGLIKESRPSTILGEQVATAKIWLDLVFSDLESIDYAAAAANIPACSVGTRHERQRLWFVAHANEARRPHAERIAPTQAQANIGRSTSMVHRETIEHIRGSFEPDSSWIVDGIRGEGFAVGAYGNAIVPQVAAEFISAYYEVVQ